eukprot:COSAG02_NODE_187_length_30377_cov_3.636271_17_plen_55_part_00
MAGVGTTVGVSQCASVIAARPCRYLYGLLHHRKLLNGTSIHWYIALPGRHTTGG